ncbi:hypothetical protein ACI2K4_35660 [Micromonospora sp. NPDC050397]|uniref:hypothetical protein n=1 Tax=Micromonospora sp. NPDC050397 TaxID=3364279 RepID=UPI00384C0EC9
MDGGFSIPVRPGLIARMAFAQFYYWAVVVAGGILVAIELPVLLLVRGEISGQLSPVGRVLVVVGWLALCVPLWRVAHRINVYFLDRTTMRLTPTTLLLGRHEQTVVDLADVRAAYFVSRHGLGGRRARAASRRMFNVLLLVMTDGTLVPLSPPPGSFVDLEPVQSPGVGGVMSLVRTIVDLLEPVLQENEPPPPEALPFLHPLEANRRYDPTRLPSTSLGWKLVRSTWL